MLGGSYPIKEALIGEHKKIVLGACSEHSIDSDSGGVRRQRVANSVPVVPGSSFAVRDGESIGQACREDQNYLLDGRPP